MGPQLKAVDRNELLDTLADAACRVTVSSLEASDSSVTTLEELAASSEMNAATDAPPSAVALHHDVLPRLAAADILDYNASGHLIHYRGQERVKATVNTMEKMG